MVQDLWPAGLIFVSSTVPFSVVGNVYTWNLGTIGHNQNATINIIAIVNATGLITNFANVTTTTFDPHPDNNSTVNVTVDPSAHVVLNKTVDNPTPDYWSLVTFTIIFTLHKEWRAMQDGTPITTAQYQDNVWIIFNATNLGPSDASITLSDTIPAGFAPANYWQYKFDSGNWVNMPLTWGSGVSGVPSTVG